MSGAKESPSSETQVTVPSKTEIRLGPDASLGKYCPDQRSVLSRMERFVGMKQGGQSCGKSLAGTSKARHRDSLVLLSKPTDHQQCLKHKLVSRPDAKE